MSSSPVPATGAPSLSWWRDPKAWIHGGFLIIGVAIAVIGFARHSTIMFGVGFVMIPSPIASFIFDRAEDRRRTGASPQLSLARRCLQSGLIHAAVGLGLGLPVLFWLMHRFPYWFSPGGLLAPRP